jgi:hypothetical protein
MTCASCSTDGDRYRPGGQPVNSSARYPRTWLQHLTPDNATARTCGWAAVASLARYGPGGGVKMS